MAAITSDILLEGRCQVKDYSVAPIAQGTYKSHTYNKPNNSDNRISIARYHPSLDQILGPNPQFSLLLSSADTSKNPFFYGGCAYVPQDDELFTTSNLLQPVDPAQNPIILISKVKLLRDGDGEVKSVTWSKLRPPPSMPMPAGVVADTSATGHPSVIYCSQGNLSAAGGIFSMASGRPPVPVVTNWLGAEFGCVCSIALDEPRKSFTPLWFLDAGTRGFKAGFRAPPTLPAAIWRYSIETGLRSMSDDVTSPWGIAVSPDGETVYITDSALAKHDIGVVAENMTAGIYAFDIVTRSGAPFLTGKRLFSLAAKGMPKGIVCDKKGNVFAGCGDGVEIWNAAGTFLGVVTVPAPVSAISWGREGEMFICAEQTLWMLKTGDVANLMDEMADS
ncbi:hypothetical protein CONLIGDRAFT_630248 [Coniochaeta ligniaria NRRL 30616]|uniref:SMP-30/Gluconolactonase/LRE-like region domain-containing protein n=1 Tax=Coniochaeta ligniaria NRRL 30616 TaxID=1408157 RepID=A0A1J7JGU2_9PEZI|nr:hypothetical protein CONLIGDRAFT_630248 [Coniochaeta ligniaria NRRL 30616]